MLWHHLWNIHLFPHIQMVPLSYTKYIYLILLLTFEYVLYSWVYFNACYNYYNSVICSAMWWNKPPHCTSLNSLYVDMRIVSIKTIKLPSEKWKSLSCIWLFVTPWTVHGIFQAMEWVAFAFSRGSSQPRNRTQVNPHCRQILYRQSH